jgi:hypothetical protein
MNKLERFSLSSALKARDIFINECFFPIVQEKYITLDASADNQSLTYRHWQEVIDLIQPFLKNLDVGIVRVGSASGDPIDGVIDHRGKGFNQEAYILSKSMLHFGSSRTLSLAAYHFETNQVCLFSSFDSKTFPLKKREGDRFIDSDKKGKVPMYSDVDPEQTINNISPAIVSENILASLNIKNNISEFKHLHGGNLSHVKTVEVVPDFSPDPSFLSQSLVNLRADLFFDEQNTFHFAQNRKLGIITDRPFSSNLLLSIRNSISRISINADNGIEGEFILALKELNIPYEIFVSKKELLPKLRLEYIDEVIEHYPRKTKKDIDFCFDPSYNMLVRSSKILVSKGKRFASKAHWITGQELTTGLQQLIDTSDFWEDCDFMNIYSLKQDDKPKD